MAGQDQTGAGGMDLHGSEMHIDDDVNVARSPSEVPEAVRKVLQNEALILLGEVFRRHGHELRLAGGVVSLSLRLLFRLLSLSL